MSLKQLEEVQKIIRSIACDYFDWNYDWECYSNPDNIFIKFKCSGQDFEDPLIRILIKNSKIIKIKSSDSSLIDLLKNFKKDIEIKLQKIQTNDRG